MATNLSIESPNFEKINSEAGQFTSDAVALLWAAYIDTRATQRRDFNKLNPRLITITPTASVDNLDLQGFEPITILSFAGSTAVNFTGMRAPETGKTKIVLVHTNGSGTITHKHNATSETANQLTLSTGADTARATAAGLIYLYLASKWREVART